MNRGATIAARKSERRHGSRRHEAARLGVKHVAAPGTQKAECVARLHREYPSDSDNPGERSVSRIGLCEAVAHKLSFRVERADSAPTRTHVTSTSTPVTDDKQSQDD